MKTDARIDWIDHARAIGICLVVLGHTAGLPAYAMQLIYSFHMPLFFFISGYLLKPEYLQLSPAGYLGRLWRTLVVPYIGFWLISFVYWLLSHNYVLNPEQYAGVEILDLFNGFLFGTGDPEHSLYIINVDLWFFTCLFSTCILYYLLRKILPGSLYGGAIILLGTIGLFSSSLWGTRLPWNLDVAGVALVFYGFGQLIRNIKIPPKTLLGVGSLIILPAWVYLVLLNGMVDMNTLQFGNGGLFYLNAIAGIVIILAIARLLPASSLSRWLSSNTIVIFPTHQLMFSVFNGISVRLLGLPTDFKFTLLASGVFTLLAIACSFPLAIVLRRFTPWLIGER